MSNEPDQMLSTGAVGSGNPILRRPRADSGPAHRGLDRPMGTAKFSFQSSGDSLSIACLGIKVTVVVGKNVALLRKHFSNPPQ